MRRLASMAVEFPGVWYLPITTVKYPLARKSAAQLNDQQRKNQAEGE